MNKINSEIVRLKREKNRLLRLHKKKKIHEAKMIKAIQEQRKLRKEIDLLKSEQKPINKMLKHISARYKKINTPQNRKKLKCAYKKFQKFANRYGA